MKERKRKRGKKKKQQKKKGERKRGGKTKKRKSPMEKKRKWNTKRSIDYVECTSGAAEEEEEGEVVCRAAALWWEEVRTEDEPLSAHTCFVNTVPTSGVLGPTVVRTLANGVADKDPKLQDLRVLQRTPAQRKRFAGLVERRLSCLLLCSVDGDVPWEHQTKIRCTPFPKGSAAWRLLQEAAQQLLQGGHGGLRTQVCNRVRAMHIRALEEAKLQRQLLDERRAGRAHPSDEFPACVFFFSLLSPALFFFFSCSSALFFLRTAPWWASTRPARPTTSRTGRTPWREPCSWWRASRRGAWWRTG